MIKPEDMRSISEGAYQERAGVPGRPLLPTGARLSRDIRMCPGGGAAPSDLLELEQWGHLMDLPTDVALRTTDYLGSRYGCVFRPR